MFVLIFAVFYFIVIMPAKKQQKKKEAMIAALKKGDKVVTSGGIHGTVAAGRGADPAAQGLREHQDRISQERDRRRWRGRRPSEPA
jgi:hypothetical protein